MKLLLKGIFLGVLMSLAVAFSFIGMHAKANSPSAKNECLRNSDCIKGLACLGGKCLAECAADVDCPSLGTGFECRNTLGDYTDPTTKLPIPAEKGGGVNAFQCLPASIVKVCEKASSSNLEPKCDTIRVDLAIIPKLDRVFTEISDTELSGIGFWSFANFNADPQVCARECSKWRDRCRAWTMFKPGQQGDFARCWLKNTVGLKVSNEEAISGVVR